MTQVTGEQRTGLIRDVLQSEQDVVALARGHGLTPDELARWAREPATRACLTGLRELADLQTQMLVSRYRLLAAERLIRLATAGEGEQEPGSKAEEAARRACVDLLKTEVAPTTKAPAPEMEAAEEADSLRQMLYGAEGAIACSPEADDPPEPGSAGLASGPG